MSTGDLCEFKYISKPTELAIAELKKLFEILEINPALLDNPSNREKGVEELLTKSRDVCVLAVTYEHKLTEGFELWSEPLANSRQTDMMRDACHAVKDEFANYSAKYNTPAKLNNFSLTYEEVEQLGKSISIVTQIPEYFDFKTNCLDSVTYISKIEYLDMGDDMKTAIDDAKSVFRETRDSIMDGVNGEEAARKVNATLEKVKDKYIDIYFEEHKKKRLGIDDAKRREKILGGMALDNLKKLRRIEILSSAKLVDLETELTGLVPCYELTESMLRSNPVCPHCRFSLGDNSRNIYGKLDDIENRLDDMTEEWTKMLLDTISDPTGADQKKFLKDKEQQVIDDFVASGKLPERVDDFFVNSINALLKGFDPVIIDSEELAKKLEDLPPLDEASFKAKVNDIVAGYIKGKDTSKLRIIVKKN
jgi:hypothetical protein